MTCSDEDRDRSRRSGAEDQRWSYRPSTRWPGDRDGRVMLYAVCIVHVEMKSTGFLVESQN
jgi:hypothetical protein